MTTVKVFVYPLPAAMKPELIQASPFCLKLEALLRLVNKPYVRKQMADPRKAPKGKLPFVVIENEDGTKETVADSTLAWDSLKKLPGFDALEQGLSDEQRATGWALARMLEEATYFILVYHRWVIPENFNNGPKAFFDHIPGFLKPFVLPMIKRQLKNTLKAQGTGRHTIEDQLSFFRRDVDALANVLGNKKYILSDTTPSYIDAIAFGFLNQLVNGTWAEGHDQLARYVLDNHPQLVEYCNNFHSQYFSEEADKTFLVGQTAKSEAGESGEGSSA